MRNRPPLQDLPGNLGIDLRQGPRGVRFLIGEVPLYGWVDPSRYPCTVQAPPFWVQGLLEFDNTHHPYAPGPSPTVGPQGGVCP